MMRGKQLVDVPYNAAILKMRASRLEGNNGQAIEIGKILLRQEKVPQRRAIILREFAHAWCAAGYLKEACTCYRGAIACDSSDLESYQGLVSGLLKLKQLEPALELIKKALKLWPQQPVLMTQLRLVASQVADWPTMTWTEGKLRQWKRTDCEGPYGHLCWNLNREEQRLVAVAVAQKSGCLSPCAQRPIDMGGPLKVAYVSSDFRDHPVGHLTRTLFSHHDPKRVEPYAYVNGIKDDSIYQNSIHSAMRDVIRIERLNDAEVAEDMRARGIDILVDCMGHTTGSRLGIGARRPTPIQVSWLGYPGTTGAAWVDILLVDEVVVPEEHYSDYSEWVHPLPGFYLPYDDCSPQAELQTTRKDWGLQDKHVVYGVFNQVSKWDPETFAMWCRIIRAVPNAVIWSSELPKATEKRILNTARSLGVDADRFVWAPRTQDKAAHLERLVHADVILDTLKYNGHASAMDALSIGVPLVTVMGDTFATRVAGAAVLAVGMDELCVDSVEEYQALAVALGNDQDLYQRVRMKLQSRLGVSPVFDTALYCQNLEAALLEIAYRHNARLSSK